MAILKNPIVQTGLVVLGILFLVKFAPSKNLISKIPFVGPVLTA